MERGEPRARSVAVCPQCALTQHLPKLSRGGAARCARCGYELLARRPDRRAPTLALTLTGLILFAIVHAFPLLTLRLRGQTTQATVLSGVTELWAQGHWAVAAAVAATTVLVPGLQLLALLAVSLLPARGRTGSWIARGLRGLRQLSPWGMMDVFMIGVLVAIAKLSDLASVVPGPALFALAALIFVVAGARASLDPEKSWQRLAPAAVSPPRPHVSASWCRCTVCELTVSRPDADAISRCLRCGALLRHRKPYSVQRTWALLLAAAMLYVPANLYPILSVTSFGRVQADTILSGVSFLLHHDMLPLAVVVFVASVLVPLLKILLLLALLLSVQWRLCWQPRARTALYRFAEAIGRWSMVDLYVVTILVALVRFERVAQIEAEMGALFFGAVVVLTMGAALSFDPRLIWDAPRDGRDDERA